MSKFIDLLRENRKYVIFCVIFFLSSLALISLVPLSGDDWMWGSPMGKELLDSWFDGYNGRYSSNLLIMAMTRSIVLRNLLVAAFMLVIMLLPSLLLKKKSLCLMLFSGLMLLLIPKRVLVQGFFWSSGFAVYVPATVILLVFLVMEKDVFSDQAPKYSLKKTAIYSVTLAILGFVGAMFLETASICNLCISIALPIFTLVKHKRIYFSQLAFCISTVVGAIFHFSNVDNKDGYRVFPTADTFMDTVEGRIPQIVNQLFCDGIFAFAVITLLCIIIAFPVIKSKNAYDKRVLSVALVINIFTLALMFLRKDNAVWYIFWDSVRASAILLGLLALLYFFSVLVIIILCVKDRGLVSKMIFCLSSAAILILPMLVVDPYGPRCLLPTCICIGVFTTLLLHWVVSTNKLVIDNTRAISIGLIAVLAAAFAFLFSIYSTVNHYSNKRYEYVIKQIEQGYTKITVPYLPYSSYIWCSDISPAYWGGTYKSYYGLDSDIVFVAIDSDSFDIWAWEFDNKSNIK